MNANNKTYFVLKFGPLKQRKHMIVTRLICRRIFLKGEGRGWGEGGERVVFDKENTKN